jgi:hypothetical protein
MEEIKLKVINEIKDNLRLSCRKLNYSYLFILTNGTISLKNKISGFTEFPDICYDSKTYKYFYFNEHRNKYVPLLKKTFLLILNNLSLLDLQYINNMVKDKIKQLSVYINNKFNGTKTN